MHNEAAQRMQNAANTNIEAAWRMENTASEMQINIHRLENVLINFTTKLEEIYAEEEIEEVQTSKWQMVHNILFVLACMFVGAIAYATFPGLP